MSFHATHAEALAAARGAGWTVASEEHCVGGVGEPGQTLAYSRPPRPLGLAEEGGRIRVDYQADEGAFLVAAITFDEGWRARLDGGRAIPVHPTAACQLGVALPAGEHHLVLEYREPLAAAGGAISLAALAGGLAAFGWSPRKA